MSDERSQKADSYIYHQLESLRGGKANLDGLTIPALILVAANLSEHDASELDKYVRVLSVIGNIWAVQIDASKFDEFIKLPTVIQIEASRPGGSFDN